MQKETPKLDNEANLFLDSEITNTKRFCFESDCWNDLNLQCIFLNKIFRQQDETFINILNNIRANKLTKTDAEHLAKREIKENIINEDVLHIFSINAHADQHNNVKFASIKTQLHIFIADDKKYINGRAKSRDSKTDEIFWNVFDKSSKIPYSLELKEGCRVMLLSNVNQARGLVNGACGIVKDINEDAIAIKFDNGTTAEIKRELFELYDKDEVIASRKQYPLRLAYGITIHKSQGMTLDKLVVDCDRIFESGQLYVALSRVRNLEGVYLKSFNPRKIILNEKIVEFYQKTNWIHLH